MIKSKELEWQKKNGLVAPAPGFVVPDKPIPKPPGQNSPQIPQKSHTTDLTDNKESFTPITDGTNNTIQQEISRNPKPTRGRGRGTGMSRRVPRPNIPNNTVSNGPPIMPSRTQSNTSIPPKKKISSSASHRPKRNRPATKDAVPESWGAAPKPPQNASAGVSFATILLHKFPRVSFFI